VFEGLSARSDPCLEGERNYASGADSVVRVVGRAIELRPIALYQLAAFRIRLVRLPAIRPARLPARCPSVTTARWRRNRTDQRGDRCGVQLHQPGWQPTRRARQRGVRSDHAAQRSDYFLERVNERRFVPWSHDADVRPHGDDQRVPARQPGLQRDRPRLL